MANITTLKELADYLRDQASSSGQITLTKDAPFLTIMQVVGDILGVEQLIMSVQPADIPTDPVDALVIDNAYTPRSSAQTFLSLIGQQTTITFWFKPAGVDQVLHMSLVIRLRQWTFGTSFDQMGGLAVNELIPDNTPPNFGFASIATTVTDPVSKAPIAIQQGLNYFSPVNLGAAAPLFDILDSKPPQLAINGPITRVANPPGEFTFDLRAPLTAQPKPLPLLKVSSPWLGMRADYVFYDDKDAGSDIIRAPDADTDEAKYTLLAYAYLGLAVTIQRTDSGTPVSLTLDVEASVQTEINEIMFLVAPSDPTQTSLDNIGNLIGGTTWDDLIPQDFRDNYLKNFALKLFSLNISLKNFSLSSMALSLGTIKPWPVPYTSFTLDFNLDWTLIWQGGTALQSAKFSADLHIAEDFVFFVTVTIPDMIITGGYVGVVTLDFTKLAEKMKNLIGSTMPVPQGLPTFSFSDLFLSYNSKTGGFDLEVTTDADIRLFGTQILSIQGLFVSVSRSSSTEGVSVTLNGVIGILGIDFYVYADIPAKGDTIFEIHLINQTIGSLLNYLVHLVDPYFDLSLDSPWNALLNISLDALVLRVNVTQGIVYLTYTTSINLGFITISGIGLIYQRAKTDPTTGATTPSSVQIALECSFLGQSYGGANGQPLAWNPMTEPAPAVPGNAALFDLNYLGLGQHVTPQIGDLETMVEIIEAMQKAMVPVDDASTSPAKLPGLAFSLDSQWLIAARFTVIGAVELIAIFNDPNLYGMRVSLSGEKVKSFAGLAFEILYKKVTPTIGLYHIELTLPDAMRQLEFGEVSITLPIVVLDIYTNGNFRIDFGFPKGLDFSRSFSVQVFPFVGYGGFYFALLNGETSRKVPKISNGRFQPVIEFGLGLSLGVGKTIDKGVFKAGLSITVIGIIEGVFAWFNPDSDTAKKDLFYHVQGMIAIVGKLYGSVDFKIIQIDVEVVIYASITLTVESYAPIYIHIEAGVSVRASIKILFFKISFSFSMTVQADFTIGSASPTPWKVIASGGGSGQKQLSLQPTAHRMLRGTALFAARPDPATQPPLDWSPVRVTPLVRSAGRLASLHATLVAEAQPEDTPQLTILLTPAFTQSAEQHLAAFATGVGTLGNTAVQAVLLPFIQNASPPDAVDADQIRAVVAGAAEMPFVQLVAHVLAWTLHARLSSVNSPSPVVTAADLRYIYAQLNSDDIEQNGFSYANLTSFIANNFRLNIQARPIDPKQPKLSATIFPILPALTMTGGAAPIDFSSYTPVDSGYEQTINAYLRQLMVDFENSVESDYNRKKQPAAPLERSAAAAPPPSMATVIFQNYFLMMARIAVQAAIDFLEEYPYTIPTGSTASLAQIAAGFSASETEYTTSGGDTLQKIADTYGVLVATIQQVNPVVADKQPTDPLAAGIKLVILIGALTEISTAQGDTLNSLSLRYQVPVGTLKALNPAVQPLDPDAAIPVGTRLLLPVIVTPESIVIANQGQPILKAGAAMPLSGITYQVRTNDTFTTIANSFAAQVAGFPDDPHPADPAAEFLKRLLAANADRAALQTGTTITFDQANDAISYTSHTNDSISLIATIYLVRTSGASLFNAIDNIVLATQAILDTKPKPADPQATLGPNTPLEPNQQISFALPDGTPISYISNPLDTATLIAAYFLSLQTDLLDLTDFVLALVALNNLGKIDPDKPLAPGTTLKIPTFSYIVHSGDSLRQISQLFNVALGYMANIPNLLAVHAVLAIPAFDYRIAAGDTLASVAQSYNLSFDALAASIAPQAGIFADQTADDKPVVLTIPRVPARHTSDLIDDLVNHGDFNQTASIVSRFLMHGLRLPVNTKALAGLTLADMYNAEVSAALATGPLYELIGQQFSFPTTPTEGYEIGLTNSGQVGWLAFSMSSYYAAAGASLDTLAARFAFDATKQAFQTALQQLNPGVSFPLAAATWLVFPDTLALKAIALSLTKDEISQISGLAGATFDPCVQRLQRLPLYRETPYRYSLQKQIPWQTATLPDKTCLADPNQHVTAPTIWPFPDTLQNQLNELPSAAQLYERYSLMIGTQEDSAAKLDAAEVGCYLWGTLVSFKVQTLPVGGQNGPVPTSYALIGTDEAGRATLQNVWAYLNTAKRDQLIAHLYLLYAPAPTSADPNGVIADKLNQSATYILRTNLSTLSQSGPSAARLAEAAPAPAPAEGEYDAPLTDPLNFVKLLWECSVVYSGGYYLDYVTADGNGLPDHLFAQGSETSLTLLILLTDPQASAKHPPIGMLHNCAVLGQNIDSSKSSIFVQPITQIIVAGDTLTSVANELNQAYGLTLNAATLAVANQEVKSLLNIGAKLDVGQSNPYVIAYGDTFASVAAAYKLQVAQLVGTGGNATAAILEPGALMQISPDQLHQVATTPPGNIGFQLLRPDPDPTDIAALDMTPGDYLKTLFQLLGYGVAQKYRFVATGEGLPAGPLNSAHDATDGLKTRALQRAEADSPTWRYQKVLPIARFAADGLGSDTLTVNPSAALPAAVNNPYRGIYIDPSTGTADMLVELNFAFQDVYGNRTLVQSAAPPCIPLAPLDLPVGYFDDLIGLDSWPSLSSTHLVEAGAGNATIQIALAFKISQYISGPDMPYDNALQNAGAHRAKYMQIMYQIWQPDLLFRLRTSLDQPPLAAASADGYPGDTVSPPRTPYPLDRSQKLTLAALAGSAYAFLTAARNLNAYQYTIQGGESPGKVADDYGTDVLALFKANADVAAGDLFGSTAKLAIPTFYTIRGGDTITSIAHEVSADDLLKYNLAVPLNAGLDIATPNREPYALKDQDTLRGIATATKTYVPALADTNQLHPLAKGTALTIEGVTIPADAGDSLQSMLDKFKQQKIVTTVGDLALANQDTANLFDRAQPNLTIADYVLQQGDTLSSITAAFGFDPAKIIGDPHNADLIGFFITGTLLQNGVTDYALQPGDTLNSVAGQHDATLDQLASLNGDRALAQGPNGKLYIPFTVTLDSSTPPASTYRASGTEKLADIAAKYLDPATKQPLSVAGLAALNRNTPYLFLPGQTISVDANHKVVVGDTDSFATLYARLVSGGYSGTFDDFATAIGGSAGILQSQALFAAPPIQTGRSQKLTQLAATYGVDATALVEANRSLSGLFKPTTLSYQGATVAISATDTFLSLINRFAKKNVVVTYAAIIDDPSFATILADHVWMLPPPILGTLAVAITDTPVNPQQIFAVTVELELARKLALIDPDFQDTRSVFLAQTLIAPQTANPAKGDDTTQTLTAYAEAFELTFGGFIKVATGKRTEAGGANRQLWAVDFRSGALSFDIQGNVAPDKYGNNPAIRYFALKPLANTLVSTTIPITPYESGVGLVPSKAEQRTFQAVDMDVWAREFLAAVDLFLSPEYAVPTYNLPGDGDANDHDGAYAYRYVVLYKGELVKWIKQGLQAIFEQTGGDLAEAQAALAQRLLISLSNAYAIDTIAQLPVTTSSNNSDPNSAPRLSGKPVVIVGERAQAAPLTAAAYSISTSKVPLVGGASPTSYLTFLVNAKNASADSDLKLNLRYAINEVEYDIGTVDNIAGYQSSSWLTFILPIGGKVEARLLSAQATKTLAERAQIGQVEIPIPLRAYPTLPSLIEQNGVGSQVDFTLPLPQLIKQLKSWDYSYTAEHQSASQETTYLKVAFNPTGGAKLGAPAPATYCKPLLAALAQFTSVYPAIKDDLAALPTLAPGAANPVVLKAANAFGELVQQVHDGWKACYTAQAQAQAQPKPLITYEYRMTINQAAQTLTLNGIATTEATYLWPEIDALVWDAEKQAFTAYPLTDKQTFPTYATYHYPITIPPLPSRYRYRFTDRAVTLYQSGAGSVRVRRNENLGEQQGQTVVSDFIYQTPMIAFSTAFTPLIIHNEAVNINVGGETLDQALDNLFSYLLFGDEPPGGSINVKLACRYGYELVATATDAAANVNGGTVSPLTTYLPLRLLPRFDFQLNDQWRSAFAKQLAQVLTDWQHTTNPSAKNGGFYFDVSVYAGEEGEVDQPLLELRNLCYPLE
jgi:LysM repeat protein